MRTTLDPCWLTMTFLWVPPTVAFQPDLPTYALLLKTEDVFCSEDVCLQRDPAAFMCHLRQRWAAGVQHCSAF